jgi:hypothetical protein
MKSVSVPETLPRLPNAYGRSRRRAFGLGVIVILSTVWIGARLPQMPEEIIHLSVGKPVMVDGSIEPGEWSDVREVTMPNDARLYLKVSGEFVCMAVQFPASRSGFTDLYIAPAGCCATTSGRNGAIGGTTKVGSRTFRESIPSRSEPFCRRPFVSTR